MSISHRGTPSVQTGAPTADDFASPPARRPSRSRWRDPRLWLGILLIVGAVAVGARMFAAADDTVAVWRLSSDVGAGQRIALADLESTRLHFADESDADRYLLADDALPAGSVLARDLQRGDLLPRSAVTTSGESTPRELPLSVATGGLPPSLSAGDRVDVWATPDPDNATAAGGSSQPRQALADVVVMSVDAAGTAGVSSDRQVVVALPDAADVAEVLDALTGASVVLIRVG